MNCADRRPIRSLFFCAALLATLQSAPARAGSITLPPEARQAMDRIYSGVPDAAIPDARKLQVLEPDNPLGYLLEAEAMWWKRYCAACELKYGMVEAWKRSKERDDEAYLALADKVIHTAQAQLGKSDEAKMHLYAGIGWALKTRIYAVRGENRNAAHAAVSARAEMLRTLELDPQMADATGALGIYNYYVATLSPIVRLLRFFMGIPGGSKEEGLKQMQVGMSQGVFLPVHVRFVLARALRQYDQKYEQALSVAEPLVARYPHNPNFLLLLGNLNAELRRNNQASEYFHAVLSLPSGGSVDHDCGESAGCAGANSCVMHAREIANSFLSSLR